MNQNPSCGPCSRHQVRIVGDSKIFIADEQQNLLVWLAKGGRSPVLNGCKGGGCGQCRIKVTGGEYQSKKMSRAHISPAEEAQGIVLACRIFARSDLDIVPMPLD